MFRYNPRVMLYAPVHVVIWEDADRWAWFTVDLPSTQVSSFGQPAITAFGREPDQKLEGPIACAPPWPLPTVCASQAL
jgi:hypothetical protein